MPSRGWFRTTGLDEWFAEICADTEKQVPFEFFFLFRVDGLFFSFFQLFHATVGLFVTYTVQLRDVEHVCVATDLWSSINNEAYISFVAGWINAEWEPVTRLLAIKHIPGTFFVAFVLVVSHAPFAGPFCVTWTVQRPTQPKILQQQLRNSKPSSLLAKISPGLLIMYETFFLLSIPFCLL